MGRSGMDNPASFSLTRRKGSTRAAPATATGGLDPQVTAILGVVGLDFVRESAPALLIDPSGRVLWSNRGWGDMAARIGVAADLWPGPMVDLVADLDQKPAPIDLGPFVLMGASEPLRAQCWGAFAPDRTLIGIAVRLADPWQPDPARQAKLRRQMEAAQGWLDDLTRLVSDWIWETDAQLRLSVVSARVNDVSGHHPRELIGRTLPQLGRFVNETGGDVPAPIQQDQPRPFRDRAFLITHANGSTRHCRLSGLPVFDPESGEFRGFRGTGRDVSAEVKALRQAAQSRAQLVQAVDSISDVFALFDRDERLVLCNERFRSLFQLGNLDIRPGTRFQDILASVVEAGIVSFADEFALSPVITLRERAEIGHPAELQVYDGRWIRALYRLTADGSIVAVGNDITELKLRERALLEAKDAAERANRAKSEFLANISHELRTPLNAIIGFSELIIAQSMGPIAKVYGDYLQDILSSGRHLLDLINDILDLAKSEAGELTLNEEMVDLASVVEGVLRLMRERATRDGVALKADIAASIGPLRADHRKLKQILLNLISNAIKFTPRGGSIIVTAKREPAGDLLLNVSDTGIGIAPEDIPTALKPFGQVDSTLARQYEGTGLGLPLTQAIVERHGGTLVIESAVGVGTIVTARLPASRFDPVAEP